MYEAKHIQLGSSCAMKVMHKKTIEEKMDPVFTALIRQELGALEMLDHPHLVRVLDLCEDEDNIYIALEMFKDGNLLEVMKSLKENGKKFTE